MARRGEAGLPMAITLGAALEAFIREHEYCGEMNSDVEGERVWMTCTCGAVTARSLEPVRRQ